MLAAVPVTSQPRRALPTRGEYVRAESAGHSCRVRQRLEPEEPLPTGQRRVVVVVGRTHRARLDERREEDRPDTTTARAGDAGERTVGSRHLAATRARIRLRTR